MPVEVALVFSILLFVVVHLATGWQIKALDRRLDNLSERVEQVSRLTERFDLMNHHQRWLEKFEQRLVRLEQLTEQGGNHD